VCLLARLFNHFLQTSGARRDEHGYYWITGRIDDVINVSGHRIGTAELESALARHDDVVEAAVVSIPHEIKGEGIHAFVTLKAGVSFDEEKSKDLKMHIREEIGAFAQPDIIQNAPGLPKTRSGEQGGAAGRFFHHLISCPKPPKRQNYATHPAQNCGV
jgi:acyl-coenzyme A synthetase/AMP-(fatty) acid ligase